MLMLENESIWIVWCMCGCRNGLDDTLLRITQPLGERYCTVFQSHSTNKRSTLRIVSEIVHNGAEYHTTYLCLIADTGAMASYVRWLEPGLISGNHASRRVLLEPSLVI